MKNEDPWLSVTEMERKTGIPSRSIIRYLTVHAKFVSSKKDHRSYQIHSDSISVLRRIRDLYAANYTTDQVDENLYQSGLPIIIQHEVVAEETTTIPDALIMLRRSFQDAISEMTAEMAHTRSQVEQLAVELRQARDDNKKLAEDREQHMIGELRRMMDEKQRLRPWWKFWQ